MSAVRRHRSARARLLSRTLAPTLLVLGGWLATGAPAGAAEPGISGMWDASVDVGSLHVPFRFLITTHDGLVSGAFFNDEEQIVSSTGHFEKGHLVLEFPTYARRLNATLESGKLSGSYVPTTPNSTASPYDFHAQRQPAHLPAVDRHPPAIAGDWLIAAKSEKAGEKAWRFIVRQSGASVSGAILRVDGDTGALTGTWRDGKLLLSHFDGARPSAFEVIPGGDGTLQVRIMSRHPPDQIVTAYRAESAAARGVEATDATLHTSVRDSTEPFRFSFPDLAGHVVSNTDSRFKGKVLVIDIGGSWCPNCHDEAPLLEELYKKYRSQGLEVVTLSFEEPEQLVNPTRLRAFIEHYGLDYTVLVAGSPEQLNDKIPQAVNLDAYPTTFFVGRDGRVRGVHAGFAAHVTGVFNTRLKEQFTRQIQQLLAEKAPGNPS
jgi:thiol-disulfide isomerase/thioredoxin